MIRCYSWPTPNGIKVHTMLEETGLDYKVTGIDITSGDQFKPSFLKISPNNKMPAIVDEKGPGNKPIAVFESGAILMYLAEKTGKFMPKRTRDRYEVIQWLMFQMGGVGPMLGQANFFRKYCPEKIPYALKRYTNEAGRLYRIMDKRLGESPYLGGDTYTIADIATFPWARNPQRRGHDINDLPNLKRWVDEIEARPAVEKALQVLAEHQSKPTDVIDDATRAIMFGDKQFAKR